MPPCTPESAETASQTETGKSQLWARPRHPQLVKKLGRHITSAPTPSSSTTPFALAHRVVWQRQTRDRLVGRLGQGLLRQVRVRGEGQGGRPAPASVVRSTDGDGLQDSPDDVAQVSKALRLRGSTRASLTLTPGGALSITGLGCDTLVGAQARSIRNRPRRARDPVCPKPQLAMTRLAVAVTDSQGVGLTRESHGQADVVAQLVAQRVDGELVVAHGTTSPS